MANTWFTDDVGFVPFIASLSKYGWYACILLASKVPTVPPLLGQMHSFVPTTSEHGLHPEEKYFPFFTT